MVLRGVTNYTENTANSFYRAATKSNCLGAGQIAQVDDVIPITTRCSTNVATIKKHKPIITDLTRYDL